MTKFITGNKKKFAEAKKILFPLRVELAKTNLVEIQSLDSKIILEHKLKQAGKLNRRDFFVEDTSLYLEALGGKLPGPFIKWFNEVLTGIDYYHLAKDTKKFKVRAQTVIGYMSETGKKCYFQGAINGLVVRPKGQYKFGFDEIFKPEGSALTLSELKDRGDFRLSPRSIAVNKLKNYLLKHKIDE
jgi:XTP/dITP diphosphohydrolase